MSATALPDATLKKLKQSVLQEKLDYLCEELGDPARYFPELRAKNILDATDTQLIRSRQTDRQKTEEFISTLKNRESSHGQHGFDVFVEALKKQKVHAHIARTLQRALNKRKLDEEKQSPAISVLSAIQEPTSLASSTSDVRREQSDTVTTHDIHPEHGPLPPQPPTFVSQTDGHTNVDFHPEFGVLPPEVPDNSLSDMVSPHQVQLPQPTEYGSSVYSQCSDELGGQSTALSTLSTDTTNTSMGDSETSATSFNSSLENQQTLIQDLTVQRDSLLHENKKLKLKISELQKENESLMKQINLPTQSGRPSNLHLSGAYNLQQQHNSPHNHTSLSPARVVPYFQSQNRRLSPSPGSLREMETPSLRSANSMGSLSSFSSKGSYNPSESQV